MGLKKRLKKLVFENRCLNSVYGFLCKLGKRSKASYTLTNHGKARLIKDIEGTGHTIEIQEGVVLMDTTIHIRGTNNRIVFSKNCIVGSNCSFWMEGSGLTITIGEGTTFTTRCHLNAQEQNCSITIGHDCMFSNQVIIRTSDSHPIYDLTTNQRINPAKDVVIGDHVWVAPGSKIMKGSHIGSGSIIGSDTMVTKAIPSNVLAVGHPARVVKEHIKWTRESLF